MAIRTRRTAYYLALVIGTTLVFTITYNVGMSVWENRPQPIYRSLEVVIQSFTTTGYGEDAPWRTPQMNLLVVVLQLAGIGLILTAVDVFAVPWLRDVLSPTAPTTLPDRENHVVICGHTPRTDVLIAELDARDRQYVLVEPDAGTASDLHAAGYHVIHGDPESTDVLDRARVSSAIALVADVADDTNASVALSAHEVAPDVRVISLLEDAELGRYHRVAGVDTSLSPRQLLGERLAREVRTTVSTAVDVGIEKAGELELAEVSIEAGSDLYQDTFVDARLHDRFGVDTIGAWFDGTFETRIEPTTVLDSETRILVAGAPEQLKALRDATTATVSEFEPQDVLLAGYGDTGAAAYDALAGTASSVTVLDIEDKAGVDVVGDARDPDALAEAGIEDATVCLLTVEDDTTAIFATLIAGELNPDVEIFVRANEEVDVRKLYRAGADYVQSLATVSGRMLASTVFEDEDLLAYVEQVTIVRLSAPGLSGSTLVEADVRAETGCSVVAVVRDGETVTDFDPARFEFRRGDEVVIAGTEDDVERFERRFGT